MDPYDAPDFDGHWPDDDAVVDEGNPDLLTGNGDMVPPWADGDATAAKVTR